MTAAYQAAIERWRAEALWALNPDSHSTATQIALAWRFLGQHRVVK